VLRDKWRVERRLGSGGMSTVYAATHRNGKSVAIKVLSDEYTGNAVVRRRFLREGYIANRVGHPGAVSVHDDETEDGLYFLVMELVEGKNLELHCQSRGGRLEPTEVVDIAEQLLEVLVAAHANGIVHRDVKPANLLLTPHGELRLLDFGIASLREAGGAASHTGSGTLLGTPGFMAPEQARGRVQDVDERTDVWSVGATMFWLLSGHLVHERATTQECAIATATEPARPLASVSPTSPPALCAIVDRALSLEPARRFASASEMLTALRGLREQAEIAPPALRRKRFGRLALFAGLCVATSYWLGSMLLRRAHETPAAAASAAAPVNSNRLPSALAPHPTEGEPSPSAASTSVSVTAPLHVPPGAKGAPARPANAAEPSRRPHSKAVAPAASDDLSHILGNRR